jgi:hypothetical protein
MRRMRNVQKILVGKVKGRAHLEELEVGGRMILKSVLNRV